MAGLLFIYSYYYLGTPVFTVISGPTITLHLQTHRMYIYG